MVDQLFIIFVILTRSILPVYRRALSNIIPYETISGAILAFSVKERKICVS